MELQVGTQATLAAIVVLAVVALAWGRPRADVLAVLALLAAVLGGVVPASGMLGGFGGTPALAVAGLGVLAAGLRGSGVLATPVRILAPVLNHVPAQIAVLGGITSALAAVTGQAGAQAFLVVPGQILRARFWPSPAAVPVALASVLGGLATPLGSGAGLVVLAAGLPLRAFAVVGVPLALGGLGILLLGWRLAPRHAAPDTPRDTSDTYVSEVHVPAGSPAIGRALGALARGGASIGARAVIREDYRRLPARPSLVIEADDVLVLSCDTDTLRRVIEQVRGTFAGIDSQHATGVVEGVVTAGSSLVGQSAADGRLGQIGLVGVGRTGGLPIMRLGRTKLRAGDTLVLQGNLDDMQGALAGLGVLKLAERRLRLGRTRRASVPLLACMGVLAAVAWGVPIAVAVLAGVAIVVVAGNVPANELYDGVDWPLVVTLAALGPVGAAIGSSGLAASVVGAVAVVVPGWVWVGAVLALALAGAAVNGPAAAVLLVPVALALGERVGIPAPVLLLAVGIGAGTTLRGASGGRLSWLAAGYVLVAGVALIGRTWPA